MGIIWELSKPELVQFRDDVTGVNFSHSADLSSSEINSADQAEGVLARLENVDSSTPAVLITIRREQGLAASANATNQSVIDVVMDSTARAYPVRFPGYAEQSRRTFSHNGIQAGEVIFSYTGPSGELAQQRFIALIKSDDEAVYLSFQAKAADFSQLNTRYFKPIVASLSF